VVHSCLIEAQGVSAEGNNTTTCICASFSHLAETLNLKQATINHHHP